MAGRKVLGSKQTNISTFFSKPQQKRPASSDAVENIAPKMAKNEASGECTDGPGSPERRKNDDSAKVALSPEQLERIQNNKLAALEKQKLRKLHNLDMGHTWKEALKAEFDKDYFQKLMKFVSAERERKTIYPPEKEVFSWTKLHPIKDTRVVIIGQDPYHGPRQAHGLCFSVQIGVTPPPSLKNIYKELTSDIPGFEAPKHGYLIGWASQGVLLLNACLTVVANQANSHKDKGWEKFTDATIKWLNSNLDGVVFILWGAYAQKKGQSINKGKHLVLNGMHPSPLSAHRGFFGCKHFSKANTYLKEKGKKEIDWTYLPESI